MDKLVVVYLCGFAIAMAASRSFSRVPCGRCEIGPCTHVARWSTTIPVSVVWFLIPIVALAMVARSIHRRM